MILKWIFDRSVALIGLLALWPVLIVVAIMVRIKMPGGPAFFVQKRIGKGGKKFRCHKFRTMTVNHGGSSVSVAGESRITPLGATLRRYKIDELPGLWDVLIGNMSFVGPRPDVPGYADKLQGDDRVVLKLRPGITGPATLKYRDEEEQIAQFISDIAQGDFAALRLRYPSVFEKQSLQELQEMNSEKLALWYNDNVIYPDKIRINSYYYFHYSFFKDIEMIFATVLGFKVKFAGEEV